MVDFSKLVSALDILDGPYDSVNPNHGKDPESKLQRVIHQDDWEAVNAFEFGKAIGQGPWIAGGACLRWYQGLPIDDSDIDIFCSSARQAESIIDVLKSYGRYSTKFESENAITLIYNSKQGKSWTMQVIKKRYYNNMQEIIDNFDISVCQIATDGNQWTMGVDTACDIRERNLRMEMPLMPDAAKRLVKYWTYGYRPIPGLLEAVQNNPDGRWKFEASEDYK